jgi:hypothetical protein
MVDFGELAAKAENLAKEHSQQVDDAIDKAAGLLGGKFGHAAQVEQGAEKLKGLIPGEGDDGGAKPRAGKGAGQGKKQGGQRAGKGPGQHKGQGTGPREGKRANGPAQ